jgi:hypothetical protein
LLLAATWFGTILYTPPHSLPVEKFVSSSRLSPERLRFLLFNSSSISSSDSSCSYPFAVFAGEFDDEGMAQTAFWEVAHLWI